MVKQCPVRDISYDYIRGLVDGEGCFTFCWTQTFSKRVKLPAFSIGMTRRDADLLRSMRNKLKLKNSVYEYPPRIRKDGYKREGMAILIVRDFGQIKNIIVPLFYNKLIGNKAKQFEAWISKMETDPDVPENFSLISKLCRGGFYERNFKNFE